MSEIMNDMDIAFPHLGIYLHDVPKGFEVGGLTIALYGIIIALGMMLGIMAAARVAKVTKGNPDFVWDISVWLIIVAILGARAYYVIFFWDSYKDNLMEIFHIRNGGLAIYGGIIAVVILIFVYCRIKKVNTYRFLDQAAYGLVIGQIIGRWGNFFNREVFGDYTDGLLAMRLPISMVRERDISASIMEHVTSNYIQVHPTFLYESLWNVGLLILMLLWMKRKKFDGEITCLYFLGYGIGRAWIEYIRTDQLYIGSTKIPVSIVVSVIMVGVSIAIDVVTRIRIAKGKVVADPWGWMTLAEKAKDSGAKVGEETTTDASEVGNPSTTETTK